MFKETKEALPDLREPPRRVGWAAVLATLFGGYAQMLGWGLLLLGLMSLCLAEPALRSRDRLYLLLSNTQIVEGELLTQESTHWGRGNSGTIGHTESIPIYRYSFRFSVDGAEVTGSSYGTETRQRGPVQIEFSSLQPEASRIVGSDVGLLGFEKVAMFLILGALGGLILLLSLPWRRRRLILMRRGVPTFARLVSEEETNVSVQGKSVRKLTLEYRPADAKTPLTTTTKSTTELTEGTLVGALYLPEQPTHIVLLRDLPDHIEVNPQGDLVSANPTAALLAACLPLTCVVVFSAWLYRVFSL